MKLSIIHISLTNILEGISSLYSTIADSNITEAAGPTWPQEWSDKYLASNKFQNWLKSIGINVDNIGQAMVGGVGRAYQINNNTIVKFTTNDKEADAAAIMQGQDSPHAAKVYGIIKLGSWTDRVGIQQNLYAIAVEKLNTGVGGKIRIATNACYAYLDRKDRFIDDPYSAAEEAISFLRPKERSDNQIRNLVYKIMDALYRMQEETGVLSQDPHGANIAFKKRKPAFFDYGRSKINWDHPKTAGVRIGNLQ